MLLLDAQPSVRLSRDPVKSVASRPIGGPPLPGRFIRAGVRQRGAWRNTIPRPGSPWDVGVLVLGADGRLALADAGARTLLDVASDADLDSRCHELRRHLDGALSRPDGAPVDVRIDRVDGHPQTALSIQIHALAPRGSAGHVLVLRRADHVAAIDSITRDAAERRGMASVSLDLAHDLRGSLNLISMKVEVLARLSDTPREASDRSVATARSTDAVRREMARLDRAIAVVLERTRTAPPAGPVPFDVRVVCQTLADLVEARARRQHVTLVLQLGEGPADVLGFADRVHVALFSLLVNALDRMPDGGVLRVDLTGTPSVCVNISDTGRAFGSDATDELGRLDLDVTRAVATAHGGCLSYHPNAESGTCFVLELPAAPL